MSKDGVQVFEGNGLSVGPRPPEIDWSGYIADDELPEGPRFAWVKDKLIDREDDNRKIGHVACKTIQGLHKVQWAFEVYQNGSSKMPNIASAMFDSKSECMDACLTIAKAYHCVEP